MTTNDLFNYNLLRVKILDDSLPKTGYVRTLNDLLPKTNIFDIQTLNQFFNQHKNEAQKMTCCIALLAEDGKSAVIAADDMSIGYFATEAYKIKSPPKKIHKVTKDTYVLIAGNSTVATTVISSAEIKEENNPQKVAENIKDSFFKYIKGYKESNVLKHFDLTWDKFYQNQATMHHTFLVEINNALNNLQQVDCGFIIVGYDNSKSEIYLADIGANGLIQNRNFDGISIVGAGTSFASKFIANSSYKKDSGLTEVEKIIRDAMKEAGISPFVGELGEIYYVPDSIQPQPKV